MNRDPFSEIIGMMRTEGAKYNPPSILVGEVVSPPPNLLVKTGGLQIDKDNLLIADHLLSSYQRTVSIPTTDGSGIMSSVAVGDHGSHTHAISKLSITGPATFTDTLKKGDRLAILPTEDKQTYIILCKVVRLP